MLKIYNKNNLILKLTILLILPLLSCSILRNTYTLASNTVKTTYKITKDTTNVAIGTSKIIYMVGGFAFTVVNAPISWPLIHDEIETVAGLSPKEAIRQGKVKITLRGQRKKILSHVN